MKIAISACLLGRNCRYNAKIKKNQELIDLLQNDKLVPFCPEDFCYGTPRPSMDLVEFSDTILAISNKDGSNLSEPILQYAKDFFNKHNNIELFIGKDRSPSCGVKSAKLYNTQKELISQNATGLMAKEAIALDIDAIDAETFVNQYNND